MKKVILSFLLTIIGFGAQAEPPSVTVEESQAAGITVEEAEAVAHRLKGRVVIVSDTFNNIGMNWCRIAKDSEGLEIEASPNQIGKYYFCAPGLTGLQGLLTQVAVKLYEKDGLVYLRYTTLLAHYHFRLLNVKGNRFYTEFAYGQP